VSVLTSPKTYAVLAAVQAGDAVACAVPLPPITEALDAVGLPQEYRPILPVVKAASALGLASARWFPGLARLTTFMLTVYFTLAVGAHLRARDYSPGLVAASAFLTVFGTLTVSGPPRR
jgi:hypothetical protein